MQSGKQVEFRGTKVIAAIGVLCGAAMFLGLPAIVLIYGAHLHTAVQVITIILAIIVAGPIVLVAAFFGIVIPTKATKQQPTSDEDEPRPADSQVSD